MALDLVTPDPRAEPPEGAPSRVRQISSLRAFHTPKSDNVRLKGFLWILPGERGLKLLGLVALGVLLWKFAGRSLTVEPTDRGVLPSASRVASLAGAAAIPEDAGRWEKRLAWGGGLELEYNYQAQTPMEPSVRSLAWLDETEEEARETFQRLNLNTVFDWGLGGEEPVGLVWLDEHAPLGDESRIFRAELERKVLGHSIAIREGARTLYARIQGDHLEDAELFQLAEELLAGMDSLVVPR